MATAMLLLRTAAARLMNALDERTMGAGACGMITREYTGRLEGALGQLQQRIVACRACPRLVEYRERKALEKRASYADWDYWGAPVPSHGDPNGRLLLVGLAPAAHGANRTGRLFTGDPTADFLMRALHKAGFASQPSSRSAGDGLEMVDAYEVAVVRCAPPQDRSTGDEQRRCREFLVEELRLLPNVSAALVFGRVAFDNYLRALSVLAGRKLRGAFAHGQRYDLGPDLPALFATYHPSPRNTNTGRLTADSLDAVLDSVRVYLAGAHSS
ncbi:MAG: uracil-DNA glycosylase [Dehalococcoidia bacterium]